MRRLALAVALLAAAPAAAQDDRTLADIRQQLSVLRVEMQGLTRELSTTGAPALGIEGTSFPDRVQSLEAELQDLSNRAERLAFRVEQVARDGGDRIETLRFQLCELTADCELSSLPPPTPLGGEAGAAPAASAAPAAPDAPAAPNAPAAPQLAVGERAQIDAARAALDAGRAAEAAETARAFLDAYPTGPLSGEARLLRGRALAASGDPGGAARVFLDAFSGAPDAPEAPAALLGLGRALGALGQREEACLALDEVGARYGGTPEAGEAAAEQGTLGCG